MPSSRCDRRPAGRDPVRRPSSRISNPIKTATVPRCDDDLSCAWRSEAPPVAGQADDPARRRGGRQAAPPARPRLGAVSTEAAPSDGFASPVDPVTSDAGTATVPAGGSEEFELAVRRPPGPRRLGRRPVRRERRLRGPVWQRARASRSRCAATMLSRPECCRRSRVIGDRRQLTDPYLSPRPRSRRRSAARTSRAAACPAQPRAELAGVGRAPAGVTPPGGLLRRPPPLEGGAGASASCRGAGD
jgi:hypothetical protein